MLLLDVCFQSVHEPTGPSEGYLQLEELVKQVVSPFLGIIEDRGVSGPTYTLGKGCSSQAARSLKVNATSYILRGPSYAPGLLLRIQARVNWCMLITHLSWLASVLATSPLCSPSPGTLSVLLWWCVSDPHL